jgi:3-methyl-2-oxobutanoate hydroxymethyltransferase
MSMIPRAGNGKITVPDLLSRKVPAGQSKITCLTAYDFPTARLLDDAGVDLLLVGDSLGMAVLGYENTLPVTMDEMLHHLRAVRRATHRALVVADMPFGACHLSVNETVRAALRFVTEGGAEAVKIEGGEKRFERIARLVDAEIPVMGHVGLTPQSIHPLGGFKVQGRSAEAARQLERDAHAIEAAGAFCVVLESVPREPTIGIGAGPDCDGQILVFHDMAGYGTGNMPKFARRYADVAGEISRAAREYIADVRGGNFPSDSESYHLPAELREELLGRVRR